MLRVCAPVAHGVFLKERMHALPGLLGQRLHVPDSGKIDKFLGCVDRIMERAAEVSDVDV